MRKARALRVGLPLGFFIGPGMPPMRAQNDLRRAAFLGDLAAALADTGGFKVPPVCALYEARPLAFKPPAGFFPSLRCHAAVLATTPPCYCGVIHKVRIRASSLGSPFFGGCFLGSRKRCALLFRIWLVPKCFCHCYSLCFVYALAPLTLMGCGA